LKLTVFDTGASNKTNDILQNRQKGVGLNNIEQRLLNYYGNSAGLSIESRNGDGMTAEIKIPVSRNILLTTEA
jgi:sensor histidine kinase YesM